MTHTHTHKDRCIHTYQPKMDVDTEGIHDGNFKYLGPDDSSTFFAQVVLNVAQCILACQLDLCTSVCVCVCGGKGGNGWQGTCPFS